MNNQYENYYGVQLLNDLHNYFPDILYGQQFENDRLVQYIRNQVANRFNLFNNAQLNHFNQNRSNLQNQHAIRMNSLNEGISINDNNDNPYNIFLSSGNGLTSILSTLIQGLTSPLSTQNDVLNLNSLEPIIVRPSEQQIENASSIVEVSNSQNSCAICQEHMNPNDRIRRLNQCRHMFHNQCIMTAFQSSVRCPVCRHDIRS
jgi:hypothetical protein